MSILVLMGDDRYGIAQAIDAQVQQIPEAYRSVAVQRKDYAVQNDLKWAIAAATQVPMLGNRTVTILEDCNLKDWGEWALTFLQHNLGRIPQSNVLILVVKGADKRTKLYKLLAAQGTVKEFELLKPWDEAGLMRQVESVLLDHSMVLDAEATRLIMQAVGNDRSRLEQVVSVLRLFYQTHEVTTAAVQALISCTTQNALQLSEALRTGDTVKALGLLSDLRQRGEPIWAIWATQVTQFRTWIKVKAGLVERKGDREIAALLKLNNPGRLYYLKQEVQRLRLGKLIQAMTALAEADAALKSGGNPNLDAVVLQVTGLMQAG